MPDFYKDNTQRFNGVVSDMTQLVHAGVYIADLIQRPDDKSYRDVIENGFSSQMTVQKTIEKQVEKKKAEAVEQGKRTQTLTADMLYAVCCMKNV